MNKKIQLVLNIFIAIALLTSPVFAPRALTKGEKNESVKSDKVPLNGSVFCGYEFDGTDDYWSMAIKVTGNSKELYEVVWTRPLSTMAPPYDCTWRGAEKMVLINSNGKKIKLLRVNFNCYYEAEIDSNGNLVNGTIFGVDKNEYTKGVWSLLKVK